MYAYACARARVCVASASAVAQYNAVMITGDDALAAVSITLVVSMIPSSVHEVLHCLLARFCCVCCAQVWFAALCRRCCYNSMLTVAFGLHWLVLSDADVDARGSIAGYAIRPFNVNGVAAIAARVRAASGHLCFDVIGVVLQ